MRGLVRIPLLELRGEQISDRRANVLSAGHDFTNRLNQFLGNALFGQIPGGPGPQNPYRELVFRMHAQYEHGNLRVSRLQLMQGVESASARHRQVQHDHIPSVLARLFEQFRGSGGFPDHDTREFVGQHLGHPSPHKGMIVGDQNAYHAALPRTGNRTVTVVPLPVVPWIERSPPHCVARSRIPSSPKELVWASAEAGMPRPLSETARTSQLAEMSKWIWIVEA